MGMPAFYMTALTALILAYADVQGWSAFAIMGVAVGAGAVIAFAAKKHSYWATVSVVVVLITADVIGRSMSEVPSGLHVSISAGDLGYSAFLAASVGWLGGWMMHGRDGNDAPPRMVQPEPQPITAPRSPFAAPHPSRRRSA